MMKNLTILLFFVILLVPANAFSQAPERIIIVDNLGTYDRGEGLFVFGQIINVIPGAFLIMQIVNPRGDLCQIQQLTPLTDGAFLTRPLPLSGNICGIPGDYDIKLFYGDYTKNTSFTVTPTEFVAPSQSALFDQGIALTTAKLQSIPDAPETDLSEYQQRLNSTTTLSELETLYVDLWDRFVINDAIYEINPLFRSAVTSAIQFNEKLLESQDLTLEDSKQNARMIYSAIFNYEIGNKHGAILTINNVFAIIKGEDPNSAPQQRPLTFSELEQSLLGLIEKTDSKLSKKVKEEIALIMARGTAPLFADEITKLVDFLTKVRYLDVVSRKDTPLYRLVNVQWSIMSESVSSAKSITSLLEYQERVDRLHAAAILLRQLDRVDRFITSDEAENSDLANIIKPEWDRLLSSLSGASSPQDILDSESKITNMKKVIDISYRLSESISIAEDLDTNAFYVVQWQMLLDDVSTAETLEEMLSIVSAFDNSIIELREKRNPLVLLKFEFEQLKQMAEAQTSNKNIVGDGDFDSRHASNTNRAAENLILINRALKAIESAQNSQASPFLKSQSDRSELLLTWAASIAPQIRKSLEDNSEDSTRSKAAGILRQAQSLENLIDGSLYNNRFLPGYITFVTDLKAKLDDVRNMVIQKDLSAADILVDALYSEWTIVTNAYATNVNIPAGGYDLDKLQKITLERRLEIYDNLVNQFDHIGFGSHDDKYDELFDKAENQIEHSNFIDAEETIREIGQYISEYLPLLNPNLIFDIDYDLDHKVWTLEGAVNKDDGRREELHVTVYDTYGAVHSDLEFAATKHGDFFTQWRAPTEPGLYIVMIQYENLSATQIINIVDGIVRDIRQEESDNLELARTFEELQMFIDRFGGKSLGNSAFKQAVSDVKKALVARNQDLAYEKIETLKRLMERYVPVRDRAATLDVSYDKSMLYVAGAVQKTFAFSEDLYVDVYDQKGDLVRSFGFKDSPEGIFRESMSVPFAEGIYVVQLQYHDIIINDFFTVP